VFVFSFLPLSLFSPASLLSSGTPRVLDEDFYKQPFADLIGYVYVAKLTSFLFTCISHDLIFLHLIFFHNLLLLLISNQMLS